MGSRRHRRAGQHCRPLQRHPERQENHLPPGQMLFYIPQGCSSGFKDQSVIMIWTLPFLLRLPAALLMHCPCAHPSGSACQILLVAAEAGSGSDCKAPPGLTRRIVMGEGPLLPASLLGLLGRPGLPVGCTCPMCAGVAAVIEGATAAQPLADPALPWPG